MVTMVAVLMAVSVLAMHEKMHQRAGQQHEIRQYTEHVCPVIDDQKRYGDAKQAPDGPVNAFP